MTEIIKERLLEIEGVNLEKGDHKENDSLKMCVMEAVAYVAGEPWSDQPQCACPVITRFLISWNDSLPDVDRSRLLKDLVPKIVGTRSTEDVEEQRSYMSLDWLIRVFTPTFLDLNPQLSKEAKALRDLDKIKDIAGARAAGKFSNAARDAARAAARDAAWVAAGDAAWVAAGDAAGDAAGAAAGAAAGDAAKQALTPKVYLLQESALDLVSRMINVKTGYGN